MASLENTTAYQGLIKTSDNAALDAAKREITDGEGNPSGLALSQTKAWIKDLNLENITLDSSEVVALVINSNGDVRKRIMNASVFNPSLQNRLFARTTGAQSSPVVFYELGTDSANSYSVGQSLSLNGSSNGIVVSGQGAVCNATATVRLRFIQNDAEGNISIVRNSETLITKNVINVAAANSAEDVVVISSPFISATSADDISLEFASTSGTIEVSEFSVLDLEKLS